MSKKLKTFNNPRSSKLWIPAFAGMTILILGLAACNNPQKTTREFMPNMVDSPAVKPQEEPMRVPPAGTQPQGYIPYPYAKDQGDLAGAQLPNPLMMNRQNLARGQKTYNTFCIVCHGPMGKGNGFIVPKFPMPPTLHSDKVRNWSDGRIFHVTTMGQNLMPSYASQIYEKDRWAAVLYVRALERAVNPTPDDIGALEKLLKGGK